MEAVSSVLPALTGQTAGKLKQLKKAAGGGALLGGAFCALDFLTVPGAFKLKYNTDGEKVEGTNWKSGLKELGKSAIKCVSYLAVPAAILGLLSALPLCFLHFLRKFYRKNKNLLLKLARKKELV